MDQVAPLLEKYGYWAIFFGAGWDHSGVAWLLVAASILATNSHADLPRILLYAGTGIVFFDHMFYGVGRIFAKPLLIRLRKHPRWSHTLGYAEAAFIRHAGSALIWGRFVAVLGRYMPFFAGILQMRYEAFLAYTIVGMLISLAVYSILPYAVGSQLVALSQYAGWLSYTLLLIICAVPLILWMRNRHHRRED